MTTRKQIRDVVAAELAGLNPAITVFTERTAAIAEECLPLAVVSIDEGVVVQNISRGRHETATLAVSFAAPGGDDAVDAYAEPGIAAIIASTALAGIVLKTSYLGYSYDREQSGASFTLFTALFEIVHIG